MILLRTAVLSIKTSKIWYYNTPGINLDEQHVLCEAQLHMFGSRSGSPYPGASGLLNSGNASAGQGGPLSAAQNAPLPSGGMPQSSVYNRTIDNEPNVVPSQFIFPSSHPQLKGDSNKIREGDFLFVLRDLKASFPTTEEGSYCENFKARHPRLSKDEVPVVTVQKLNELLRSFAKHRDTTDVAVNLAQPMVADADYNYFHLVCHNWWQDPELVAQWAVPFGAALNSVQLNRHGGGGDPNNRNNREDWQAHNVVVSRKANVKNNFYSIGCNKGEKWHSQSCTRVGVQYSLEKVLLEESGDEVPCVQVSFLLLDEPSLVKSQRFETMYNEVIDTGGKRCMRVAKLGDARAQEKRDAKLAQDQYEADEAARQQYLQNLNTYGPGGAGPPPRDPTACTPIQKKQMAYPDNEMILFNNINPPSVKITQEDYAAFEAMPLGDPVCRTIVPIGRVLHSAPRQPSAYECLTSCHNKPLYDSLKPIEIELGCP